MRGATTFLVVVVFVFFAYLTLPKLVGFKKMLHL